MVFHIHVCTPQVQTSKCPPRYAYTPAKTQIDACVNTYATNTQHIPASIYHAARNTHIYIHILKCESQEHTHTNVCTPSTCTYTHILVYTEPHNTHTHTCTNTSNTCPTCGIQRALSGINHGALCRGHVLGPADTLSLWGTSTIQRQRGRLGRGVQGWVEGDISVNPPKWVVWGQRIPGVQELPWAPSLGKGKWQGGNSPADGKPLGMESSEPQVHCAAPCHQGCSWGHRNDEDRKAIELQW